MAMLANMPGRWPRDSFETSDELYLPAPPTSSPTEAFPQFHPVDMNQASSSSRDELFFSVEQNNEAISPSYLLFEPVVSSVTDNKPIDWRRYDSPGELLEFQDDTSEDIRNLLTPSIEIIQARHAEEIEGRVAAARQDRPLTRGRKVSVKPQRIISGGASHLSPSTHRARLSDSSSLSISSFDSGYASRSSEIGSPSSPKMGPRSPFGLSSLFKLRRKDRARIEPSESSILTTQPTREAPGIPSAVDESSARSSRTEECVSCLDDFAKPEMIKLSCHSYCMECFQRLISTSLESETQWPAKCCLNTIPSSSILPHIDGPTKNKFREREAEWSIPAGDRIYCAQPSCSTWIPAKYVNTQLHSAKCPKCAQKACTICRGEFHNGNDCPQDPNLQATIDLAEMEGWKRCYSCHALVEHNNGCRHMTCRCKAQFCYICGLKWRTCGCTDTQLAEIQHLAVARRHEQTAREARAVADAEEERIVLQMVADYQRAEAEREAQEAEARGRVEEEQRQRREEERIVAINLRFHQLTNELELLHDVQRVLIAERYEFEDERMKKEHQDKLDTFSIRHPHELQVLDMESKAIIAEEEHKFKTQYQIRLAEERRIEKDYVDQLTAYWKEKPVAVEYYVREARDQLRKDQNKEYRFWDAYRRTQLQAVSEREKRRMEALLVKQRSEVTALDGRSKIDEVEWKRKKWAEGLWVEKVAWERGAMLQAREQEEYSR